MKKIELNADGENTDYTFPELVGNDVEFIALVPQPLAEGEGETEYKFQKNSGTIKFGAKPPIGQHIIILYNRS